MVLFVFASVGLCFLISNNFHYKLYFIEAILFF